MPVEYDPERFGHLVARVESLEKGVDELSREVKAQADQRSHRSWTERLQTRHVVIAGVFTLVAALASTALGVWLNSVF